MNNVNYGQNKIFSLHEVSRKVKSIKSDKKSVVLSLGVFDIIHPGIIQHLNEAKQMGDFLVVAVIEDSDVKRGPGRPVFDQNLRAFNVAAIEQVDLVCIVRNEVPFECVKTIEPDIFAKGQKNYELNKKIYEKIFSEDKETYLGSSKIKETNGFSFSSSEIINNFLDIYPEETKQFIKKCSEKYSIEDFIYKINKLKDLKLLLIGDGIIDEYHYCTSLGKSSKAHLIVSKYLNHEIFAGGAFAIANHLASICEEVKLVTLLGEQDKREDFIEDNLKPNVKRKFFYRKDGPSVIKKRYVNQYLNQKVFEINYLNDQYIDKDCETQIITYLIKELPKYDLVLVSDFGHGFITKDIIRTIEQYSSKIAVNTQTNSANMGFNVITRYNKPNFVCLDEVEARLSMQNRFDSIENVAKKLFETIEAETLIVTLGKNGSLGISGNSEISYTPIFSSKIVDTVGAGDAVFSYVAACFAKNYPLDFITFIGNAVGALAVQIMCNKKSVEKHELYEFLNAIFKQNGTNTQTICYPDPRIHSIVKKSTNSSKELDYIENKNNKSNKSALFI
jgi:rfaE bifunctional protein kinase chain/domain